MNTRIVCAAVVVSAAASACSTYKTRVRSGGWPGVEARSQEVIEQFRQVDPTLQQFFDAAHAYAVFPKVTKGAAGIGAAQGHGAVYEGGILVGHAILKQITVGAQLGGKAYSELVFLEDLPTFEQFKKGDVQFSAQASEVAAAKGAAADADYDEGVAIFTRSQRGLMFEASIGGQKFSYTATE